MYLEKMKHAIPLRRYRIGNFIATLLSHDAPPTPQTEYAHALVIYQLIGDAQTAKPALVISAERTIHDFEGEFSLVSSRADGDSTHHRSSKAWAFCDTFEAEALKLAGQLLNIEDKPIIMTEYQIP